MNPGTRIAGRYRIVRLLGRGGMGAVYECVDEATERARAIKLMHAYTLDSADARAHFELEARVSGRVDSPYLVDIVDAGVDGGVPFLVMELLTGDDLGRRLERLGPRPGREVVAHLAQVALALTRLHARGIVHRDLKPGNLFLEERAGEAARVKVLDLGVAKVLTEAQASTTASAGTPLYMAPEQVRGRQVSIATDVYALGHIAYALLTAAPYWTEGRDRDPIAFALLVADGPRDPASRRARARGVELPEAFDAWFARATAKQPSHRFATAIAAIRALAAALDVEVPVALAEADDVPPPPPVTPPSEGPEPSGEPAPADEPYLRSSLAGQSTLAAGAGSTEPGPGPQLPPSPRRRWALGVAGGLAAVPLAVTAWWLASSTDAVQSPLAARDAVLACPILAVDRAPAEDGWLGAAAATAACDRSRALLGGGPDRTLVPAELLALPRGPVDDPAPDPYADATARDRTLTAARARGTAYLDGRVSRSTAGYRVELVLHGRGGAAVARAAGERAALYEAVRAAMEPLVRSSMIPRRALDPVVADYTRARDTGALVALVDVTMALANNAGALDRECERALTAIGPSDLASWLRHECAFTLGLTTPAVELPGGASAGALAARARVDHMANQRDDAEATARLVQLHREEPSPVAQAIVATTLSCLMQRTDPAAALDWAQRAIQADPRNLTGERCAPWVQLASVASDTGRAASVTEAWRAWAPWDSYAWTMGLDRVASADVALAYARRAYALSPFDAYVADLLADRLLERGEPQEARNIALSLARSRYAVHIVESELIHLRVDASEGRFEHALRRAESALAVQPGDSGWVRTQRLEIAWRALQLALIAGRGAAVADRVIANLIMAEPPPIDGVHIDVPLRLVAICAYASREVASRCFTRLAELEPRLAGGVVTATAPFTEGARRYARGDLRGAATAWRPLLAEAGSHIDTMAEAMVAAFTATGEYDVVERIVGHAAAQAGQFHGASLVTARAAQAARARGDHAEAARLARRVIDAWSTADTDVPIVAEMRRLTP